MKKIAVMVASTIALGTMASAALADSTEPPSPANIVEGTGGAAGNGVDATAFTGGDTSTAAIVVVALVAAGLLALWISRRRVAQAS